MGTGKQGIGLVIGDEYAVVLGTGSDLGEWAIREPAVVAPPSMSAQLELLLAGTEAVSAGTKPLYQHPRRRGYVPGDSLVARDLLAALFQTLRQEVPPANLAVATSPPVVVLTHTASAVAADVVAQAAAQAGWGKVRIVSELAALAALEAVAHHFTGDEILVEAAERSWVHGAAFLPEASNGKWSLHLRALRAHPAAESPSRATPPDELVLARGGACIAAHAIHFAVDEGLPLTWGLLGPDGRLLPLGLVRPESRLVRAFHPPGPDGALIHLAVGCQAESAACQIVLRAFLDPIGTDPAPWLLTVETGRSHEGEVRVATGDGTTVVHEPFRIRLP